MRHKLCWRVAVVIWCIAIGARAVPIDDQKEETPFSRASVESIPDSQHNANIRIADNSEFGSKSLPLRTAVESVPAPSFRYVQSQRLPLRDAVEKRPDAYDAHLTVITKEFENLGIDPWSRFDSEEVDDNEEYQTNPNSNNHYYGAAKPLNKPTKVYNYDAFDSPSLEKKLNYQVDNKRGKYHKGNANLEEMRQTADWLPENSLPLVVCYIKGWSAYRAAPLGFNANILPGDKCSHIHYAFATIDPDSYLITSTNEDYDVIKGGYRMVTGLKQEYPELRTLISVGGDGSEHRLSEMVYNPVYRTRFVNSVIDFLKQYDFDGLDLHWTYPALDNQSDKDNYIALLFELRQKFTEFDYTLSIVLPSSKEALDIGYDLPAVSGLVDYLTVHAWDMNNHDGKVIPQTAQHQSQLLQNKENVEKMDNVQNVVKYLLNNGVSNDKLVLGIPFFGRSYTLKSAERWQPNAPIVGLGKEGPYTQTKGFLAYFEICMAMHSKGKTQTRRDSNGNSYVVLEDQWVGFDDLETVKNKMMYVRANKLAGGAVWSVDMDDFRGLCGEKWPLLTALSHTLKDKPVQSDDSYLKPVEHCNKDEDSLSSDPQNCAIYHFCNQGIKYRLECDKGMLFDPNTGECGYFELSKCLPGHSLKISVNSIMNQQVKPEEVFLHNDEDGESHALMKSAKLQRNENNDKKVICYITNWAFYRRGDGKFVPEHMDTRLCTHVVYAYATLTPDTLVAKEFDPWTDIDNNLYERVTSLKDVKVLLGLGGWTDSSGDKYSRLVSSGTSRRNFITQLIAFLRKHNFRGLHLDWNYPVCWQSNCQKGTESDKVNLAKFAQEISQEFKKQSPPMELGIAVSGFKEIIDVGYDLRALGAAADFLSAMTYDYHGGWDRTTGHGSPLTARPGERLPQYTVEYAIKHLIDNGAPREKLLLGLAFYGQTFRLEEPESGSREKGLPGSPAVGPGESGEFTKQPGMLAYYEICYRIKNLRWQTGIQQGAGPYTYNRNQWVGYEDPDSIKDKVKFAMREQLGGVVAWTTDLDDFSNRCCFEAFPLLTAANRALGRITGSQQSGCARPPPPVTPPAPVMTTVEDSGMMPTSSTSWPSWSSSTSSSQQTWWTQSTTPRTTTTTTQRTTTTTTRRPATTTTTVASSIGNEPTGGVGSRCQPGTYTSVPTDCTAYLQCVSGEFHLQRCGPGLHWDAKNTRCDWPRSAKCKEQSEEVTRTTLAPITARPPTAATPLPTKKPTTQGIVSDEVEDSHIKPGMPCTTGTHYAHEICEKFYICDNGQLLAQNCAPGLAWNDKKNMCDFKSESTCTNKKTSTKKPEAIKDNSRPSSPAPRPTQPQKRPDEIIGKPCRSGDYMVYPGDCSRYLHCMWGKYQTFQCSTGLHWHSDKKICDWPKRAQCSEVSSVDAGALADDQVKPVQTRPPPVVTPTRRPTTTTTMSAVDTSVEGIDSHYKVVCYFTNWAWYRPGIGKYVPEDIDPTLCTHIVYGFAVLEYDGLIMKAHDSWADFDNKFYERVVAYKKMGLKVSLALGGWNDSAGDKYSRLVNNPAARAKFIKHAVGFLQKFDFDGLDLDWEYPKCWQVDCSKGPDSDKAAFSAFVQEIATAFRPHGLLLSSAVSPSKTVIDAGYDVPAMAASMDWIAVMTYDFHGQWDKKTGHVAPLFYHPEDDVKYFNADYAIKYWIKKGAPASKIIMGMPMYGQSFTLGTSWDTPPEQLARKNGTGLNVPARSGGEAGEFTRAKGFLAYYEICHRINNGGWTVVKDPKGRMGPYAFKGDQWVSFDDVDIIKKKTQFVRSLNLGGAMIWALDLDDFRNRCGGGKHPLLNTIKNVLRDPPSKEDLTLLPVPDDEPQSIDEDKIKPSSNLPATIDEQSDEISSITGTAKPHDPPTAIIPSFPEGEFKVVCYFTNWAWYRQGPGKYLPSDIDASLCTHVVYGFAVLDSGKLIIKPHDSWADIDNKFYEKVTAYKQKGIRVLIAIGGWNDSAGDKYSRLANDPSARKRFIVHVVDFIKEHNFDGLDLDWEYPKCWQVDCTKGPDSDKRAFASLVTELREAFKPYGFLLSSAVSPSKRVMDAGYDIPVLSKMLDWIAVMAYDYHGQWDKQTGHVAPMYAHPLDKDKTFNANFTIHYWIEQGASPKKLVMGMPTYGQSFSLAESSVNGLNAPTYGGGEAGEETRARGFLSFYEICERINQKGWKVIRDPAGHMGPYATLGDQWVSFDDDNMIIHKSEYVRAMGLGGAMIWALDLDDFHGKYCGCGPYPLLSNINVVLRGRTPSPPTCKLASKDIVPKPPVLPIKPVTEPSKPVILNDPDDEISDSVLIDGDNDASVDNDVDTSSGSIYPGAPCNNQMFSADPKDCNKYYLCNNGGFQKMSCPQQLHWNNDHCDWPASAKCEKDKKGYSRDLLEPSSRYKAPAKLICYFTNWAWYRSNYSFTPDDIETSMCTHIVYSYATLDEKSLVIVPKDSWTDIDNDFYGKVTALREKDIKVLIAVGGYDDSASDKYSRLANDPKARAKFVKSTIKFLNRWKFDGLEMSWQYPVCKQSQCDDRYLHDKEGFAALMSELSIALKAKGLLLAANVSPSPQVVEKAYDVETLAETVDWLTVDAYDYHGYWEHKTNLAAPLYSMLKDDQYNVNFTINYWLSIGMPAHRLVLGVPMYGHSYTMAPGADASILGEKVIGPGEAGRITDAPGFLAFYEICENVKVHDWSNRRELVGGAYAFKANQFVAFGDTQSMWDSASLAVYYELGGVAAWAPDLDDWKGDCDCGRFPLLRALYSSLRGLRILNQNCP